MVELGPIFIIRLNTLNPAITSGTFAVFASPDGPTAMTESRVVEVSAPDEQGTYCFDWKCTFTAGAKDTSGRRVRSMLDAMHEEGLDISSISVPRGWSRD